jgi:F-type H+-transporting ATPase subunit delta
LPRATSPRRFAQAAFQIALERDELDKWLDDLSLLADAISNDEFRLFLDAPEFTLQQKVAVIQESLGQSVGDLARNLLAILAARSEAHLLPGIVEHYQRMLDQHRGIEHGEVTTAVPLADAQRAQVTAMLQEIAGKEIRLTTIVDPQILGGLVARVGDRVIDGSTLTKLRSMRTRML